MVDAAGRVVSDIATVASATPTSDVASLPPVHFELASENTPVEQLLPLLSRGHVLEAFVVDTDARLIGVITQTNLLAVMGRANLARAHHKLRRRACRAML